MEQPNKNKTKDSLKLYQIGEKLYKLIKEREGVDLTTTKGKALSDEINSLSTKARELEKATGIKAIKSYAITPFVDTKGNYVLDNKGLAKENPKDIKDFAGIPRYANPSNTIVDKNKNAPIQLDEVSIKTKSRNTPEWNAYKDSLYAYNNVNKLHDEGIDKFREEGLKNAKESSKEYWKNKDNFIYYDKLKSRAGDTRYDVPDKSFLGNAESDGYTAVFMDYDNGINKNYPHSIDNFTAEQMKKGINPMYFVPYGEGGGKGVFKKPTKPKEKSIGIDSKGINLEYPKTSTPELNLRTGIEKLPYNISTERTMSDDEGNRYGLHKGKVKQIQSRDEYRKANLRPNSEAFALGGNIEPDPPVKNKDFVTNWMSDPKTKGRLVDNQGHTEGRAQELINNSLMDLSTVNTYHSDHFKKPNKDIIKELGSGNSYMYDLKGVKDVKRTMKDTLVKGAYNSRLHSLIVKDEKDKGTIAHEKAHSMREFQDNQDKFIKDKFPVKDWDVENEFLKKKDPKLYKSLKKHKEYLDEDGLYPRVMDIRQQLDLKPGEGVDSARLETLKDRTPYDDMLEYFNESNVINVLNTVADNSKNTTTDKAALGGEIDPPKTFITKNSNIYKILLPAAVGVNEVIQNQNNTYSKGGKLPINTINTMAKKRIKITRGKDGIPKAFWGALLSTGVSLVSGMIARGQEKKLAKETEDRENRLLSMTESIADESRVKNYGYEGEGDIDYYQANGGKLATPSYSSKGGDLIPLSSDSELAQGNKHGEANIDGTSGIKLYNGSNEPFVEIEDEEVIKDGTKVYSDRLKAPNGKTFAANAELLARRKSVLERDAKSGDILTNTTNERKMANVDKMEDMLFEEQEAMKEVKGIGSTPKKAEMGAFLNDLLNDGEDSNTPKYPEDTTMSKVAPYMDNVVNAVLTANTPKVPKLRTENFIPMKTKVNANPQLGAVSDAVNSATENIKRNSSDSNVARNEMTALRLRGAEQKSSIYANKDNMETQLHNQNVGHMTGVVNRNLQRASANDTMKLARQGAIQSRISANVKNIGEDIIDNRNYKAAQRFNQERVDIGKQMYNQGTTRRALLNNPSELYLLKQDPDMANRILEQFKGTPEESRLRSALGIPMVDSVSKLKSIGTANIN